MMGTYAGGMVGVGWILMGLLSVTLIVAIVLMVVGMLTQPRPASAPQRRLSRGSTLQPTS
jgi:putative membrane protein